MFLFLSVKIFLIFLFSITTTFKLHAAKNYIDFYSQNVYFGSNSNIINQSLIKLVHNKYNLQAEPYIAFYADTDSQTNDKIAYTDKQFTTILGVQSKTLFKSFPTRLFLQNGSVRRLGPRPSINPEYDNDFRFGAIGYNLLQSDDWFNEYYYAILYTSMYDSKVIFQAWDKVGLSLKNIDYFLELNTDSFNLTTDGESTLDLRPGIRKDFKIKNFKVSNVLNYINPINNENQLHEFRFNLILSYYGEL